MLHSTIRAPGDLLGGARGKGGAHFDHFGVYCMVGGVTRSPSPIPWRKATVRDWEPSDDEGFSSEDEDVDVLFVDESCSEDKIDLVDWEAIEKECGLSADQLGEGYEADAAMFGASFRLSSDDVYPDFRPRIQLKSWMTMTELFAELLPTS